MASYRLERVAELLKEVLSEIIQDLKDPRIGFISILEVKVSPDLRHARVSISLFGEDSDKKAALEVLNNAKGFIKKEVTQRGVSLRRMPDFVFIYDDSIEYSAHITELINKAKADDERLVKKID